MVQYCFMPPNNPSCLSLLGIGTLYHLKKVNMKHLKPLKNIILS